MKMKAINFRRILLYTGFFFLAFAGLSACDDGDGESEGGLVIYHNAPDYSNSLYWVYGAEESVTKEVDVFFAYPTAYSGDELFCTALDPGMRAGAQKLRNSMATVYEESANLFMPYYGQANATRILSAPTDLKDQVMREVPFKDLLAAFEYYLEHYNEGRPFILAGHSQGSNTLLYLLEYIKDKPELMDRMICAYLIGYSVTDKYLAANPGLTFAQGRTDTGVIVSWNTESPGVILKNPVVEEGAIAINPITWTREETHAAKELSLGARIEEITGHFVKKEHFADAQIKKSRGVIICSTVNPEDYVISNLFPLGVLHGCDYPFYYYDLQQNVKDRVDAYLQR